MALLKKKRTWIILLCVSLPFILWMLFSNNKALNSKKFVIAHNVDSYPSQLISKERNFSGFVSDLMGLIAKEEDFKYNWIETSATDLVEGLDNGYYDAILTFIRPTIITKEKYLFSSAIYEHGPVLVVQEGSSIDSLEDLESKTIGVSSGEVFSFKIAKKTPRESNYILTPFENMSRALDMLANGQIDAVLMDVLPAYSYIQTFYPGKLRVISAPLTDEALRLIAKSQSEVLIKKFDTGLKKLKENKTYEALLTKWQLVDPESFQKKEK